MLKLIDKLIFVFNWGYPKKRRPDLSLRYQWGAKMHTYNGKVLKKSKMVDHVYAITKAVPRKVVEIFDVKDT